MRVACSDTNVLPLLMRLLMACCVTVLGWLLLLLLLLRLVLLSLLRRSLLLAACELRRQTVLPWQALTNIDLGCCTTMFDLLSSGLCCSRLCKQREHRSTCILCVCTGLVAVVCVVVHTGVPTQLVRLDGAALYCS